MQVHIDRGGQQFGPYTVEQINAHLADGSLLPSDLGWTDGMADWVPITQVSGVTTVEVATPPPPPVAPDAPPSTVGSACPKCQAEVSADQVICMGCGTNLQSGQTHTLQTTAKPAGSKKLLIGIGAGVGVLALAAAIWFFALRGDDTKKLAEFIKDKRIYFNPPKPQGAPKGAPKGFKMPEMEVFAQFNADGTMQMGAIFNGAPIVDPKEKLKYVVDGLTIKITKDGKEDSTAVFSKDEPAKGDTISVTEDDGEKKTLIISKIGPAEPISGPIAGMGMGFPGGGEPQGGFGGKGRPQQGGINPNTGLPGAGFGGQGGRPQGGFGGKGRPQQGGINPNNGLPGGSFGGQGRPQGGRQKGGKSRPQAGVPGQSLPKPR